MNTPFHCYECSCRLFTPVSMFNIDHCCEEPDPSGQRYIQCAKCHAVYVSSAYNWQRLYV